jgi:hypothetical protein
MALILSGVALLISVITFFTLRSYVIKRTGEERILAEFRARVKGIVAEIDTATDRDKQLLDERVMRLKKLLEDTDVKIADLESRAQEAAVEPPVEPAPPDTGQWRAFSPPDTVTDDLGQKRQPGAAAELAAFLRSRT